MKTLTWIAMEVLLGLSPLGLARAESLSSTLTSMVTSSAQEPRRGDEEPGTVTGKPDKAEEHVLDAEARDAATRGLENARDGRK
jgi:hypothetical protein